MVLAVALLSGCASSDVVPRRQSGIIVGSQGAGSEVVFAGVQVAAAGTGMGDEFARRDASLSIRGPVTAFDYDSWPQPPSPSLTQVRQLSLPRSAHQVLYFNGAYQSRAYRGPCTYWP